VAEREDAKIAADLVKPASPARSASLAIGDLGASSAAVDPPRRYGNAMRAATLEARLEELGVLRSFSRPRVSTTTPTRNLCSARSSSVRLPQPAIRNKKRSLRVGIGIRGLVQPPGTATAAFKFVTPHQRHSGIATAICQQRADVYEKSRQTHPETLEPIHALLRQPEEVWINKPPEEPEPTLALPSTKAALNGS